MFSAFFHILNIRVRGGIDEYINFPARAPAAVACIRDLEMLLEDDDAPFRACQESH